MAFAGNPARAQIGGGTASGGLPGRESEASNRAIATLRKAQAEGRRELGIVPQLDEKEVLQLVLRQVDLRVGQSVRDGEFIRAGVFKYPARTEELRWQRTRDIIRRAVPGPNEDAVYLEIIAREAASIEMFLRQEYSDKPNATASATLDRVRIGTVALPHPNSSGQVIGGDFVVMLPDGLMSYLYQAAKAVVLSWRPIEPRPGTTSGFSLAPDDIEQVLDGNPVPEHLLYATLHSWLFAGVPRAIGYSPPAAPYIPPLTLLITFAERFVVGHEYSHLFVYGFDKAGGLARSAPPPSWSSLSESARKELLADASAFFLMVGSGREVDQLPPNVALQGAFFTLTALDIALKTVDVMRCGRVQPVDDSASHPPVQRRIEQLKDLYRQQVLDHGAPVAANGIDLAIEGALAPSRVLDQLWRRIRPRLVDANRQGAKLHRIWGEAACAAAPATTR
jgi:hypothetical protein